MAARVHRCRRCSKRLRRRTLTNSMAQLTAGTIDHLICNDCLTIGEYAEMTVREATMEAAVTRDGTIMVRPKVRRP